MTVSPAGIFIYQGYGAVGYTLLQYMDRNSTRFPLTHTEGREYAQSVTHLLKLSVDHGGKWTKAVNDVYQTLFDVDLLKMGNMKLNMQFDPFVKVQSHPFSAETVTRNFALLPSCNLPQVKCVDADIASGKITKGTSRPDGGDKARYTPCVRRLPHSAT